MENSRSVLNLLHERVYKLDQISLRSAEIFITLRLSKISLAWWHWPTLSMSMIDYLYGIFEWDYLDSMPTNEESLLHLCAALLGPETGVLVMIPAQWAVRNADSNHELVQTAKLLGSGRCWLTEGINSCSHAEENDSRCESPQVTMVPENGIPKFLVTLAWLPACPGDPKSGLFCNFLQSHSHASKAFLMNLVALSQVTGQLIPMHLQVHNTLIMQWTQRNCRYREKPNGVDKPRQRC